MRSIANSTKVALGIGTCALKAMVTQVNHCIVPYAQTPITNDQCKTKETFFYLAVYIFKLTGLAGQV